MGNLMFYMALSGEGIWVAYLNDYVVAADSNKKTCAVKAAAEFLRIADEAVEKAKEAENED